MRFSFTNLLQGSSGRHGRLTMLSSAVLMSVFLSAGVVVFPEPTTQAPRPYVLPRSLTTPPPGSELPVFRLRGDAMPLKSGMAVVLGETVHVGLWPSTPDDLTAKAEPVVLTADLRTLWALADPEGRAALRKAGDGLVTVTRDLLKASASPVFEAEYMPAIRGLVRRAMLRAWEEPETRYAFADALYAVDTAAIEDSLGNIAAVFMEKVEGHLWQRVKSATARLLGMGSAAEVEGVLSEVLRDPRVQRDLAEAVPHLLRGREFDAFVVRFAAAFANALLAEEELLPVMLKIAGDTRVIATQAGVGDRLTDLLRTMPRHLANLREDRDHNALASYVVRTLLQGRKGWVVVYLTPEQRAALGADSLPPPLRGADT